MNTINAYQLKQEIDSGVPLRLVNALEEFKFRACHIPGSINLYRKEEIEKTLDKNDYIVVYCTDAACNKSILLYSLLEVMGYENIKRFVGGMREWAEAGFPLVGERQ